jgi:16S rRNA (cytidine1402-2'-O)-methyltransferase
LNHDIERASAYAHAAALAAGAQQYPKAALYVVATPIGNLADVTLRALHVLHVVDAVACEDTRVGGALLQHYGIHKPLIALHAHNERDAAQAVLARLQSGERVAFISDAGTPAVSDPGARLVADVRAAGLRCVPIPGASAVAAALSVAGDDHDASAFYFLGFAPAKGGARRETLAAAAVQTATVVMYESPHRMAALAQELASLCPTRRVTVARELTKQFEAVNTMRADTLPMWVAADTHHERGEFVVLLHALAPIKDDAVAQAQAEHTRLLTLLMAELPLKQAVSLAASISGAPRNALYTQALALRDTDA